ncbi:hypothetical protein DL767_005590 [Monosporascus sp. MG133]|nr:hypothetical protein DL767_005590 [Monosporascus sp. MG133]
MKLSPLTLASFVVLFSYISAVTANFDLYHGVAGAQSYYDDVWQIFDTDPDCNQVYNTDYYLDSNDVSGNKIGVRCEDSNGGCGGNVDPIGIDVVEMHFSNNPLYHFTIYKNRGNYDMIGLDGRVYGHCILFPANTYFCSIGIMTRSGHRKFRCLTEFTAAQINAAN